MIQIDNEIVLYEEYIVISKIDSPGKICYCNPIFIKTSGCCEAELIGPHHNIPCHPDMFSCKSQDFPYPWLAILFAGFIVACKYAGIFFAALPYQYRFCGFLTDQKVFTGRLTLTPASGSRSHG